MEKQPRPVAVVTGASRGIGRAIAVDMAKSGRDVVVGYSSSAQAASITAQEAATAGARVSLVPGDMADPATATELAAAAASLGRLEVWVNNAGVSVLAPLLETTSEDAARTFAVNALGAFHGTQAAARAMAAAGGCIINIASDLGLKAAPLLAAYSASKFAVVGLTQAAALELAPLGITVNAVCPGTVETDMVMAEEEAEAELTASSLDAVRKRLVEAVPLGRLCMVDDVSAVVAWLAGPGGRFVTGQALCTNGGAVLH